MLTIRGVDLIAEVEACQDRDPEDLAKALGLRPGSVARSLIRNGRPDLAKPFSRAEWARQRRERRAS